MFRNKMKEHERKSHKKMDNNMQMNQSFQNTNFSSFHSEKLSMGHSSSVFSDMDYLIIFVIFFFILQIGVFIQY
jgi:hypothetical protein